MASPNGPKRDWIALLEQANALKGDTVPKGFRPLDEWLEEFEIGETTWRRRIPILEERGVMVRGYFKTITKSGQLQRKPFWKRK